MESMRFDVELGCCEAVRVEKTIRADWVHESALYL